MLLIRNKIKKKNVHREVNLVLIHASFLNIIISKQNLFQVTLNHFFYLRVLRMQYAIRSCLFYRKR